jgi:hypothetical protein
MSGPAPTSQDVCGFYRLAMDLRMVGNYAPIRWADAEIIRSANPDIRVIDLSLTDPESISEPYSALRDLAPRITGPAFRMIAALLYEKLVLEVLEAAVVANILYALSSYSGATEALGDEIHAIDEWFEPWAMGPVRAASAVREYLRRFADVPLPPLA